MTGLVLLEHASVRLAAGELRDSTRDFERADTLLDRQAMTGAKYLRTVKAPRQTIDAYERGWAEFANLPYAPKVYERLLLNPLNALAHLGLRNPRAACVEARRFGVMADFTESLAPERAVQVRAFGELVSSLACLGVDPGQACQARARAQALGGNAADLAGSVECSGLPAKAALLLVVVGYGRPSHPVNIPTGSQLVSLVSGPETKAEAVDIQVDEQALQAVHVLDVDRAVLEDFEDAQQGGELKVVGETRGPGNWSFSAWQTLPAQISVALVQVTPGQHAVSVRVRGSERRSQLTLEGGSLGSALFFAPW